MTSKVSNEPDEILIPKNSLKMGFVVPDLIASQLSYYLIMNLNEQCATSKNDYVVFFENVSSKVIDPHFAIMNTAELWTFDGTLISTTVSTTLTSINSMSPAKKYFYVWDLEWLREMGKNFEYNIKAFISDEVELIARSEDHSAAIKNYCNRDVIGIVDDFNINQFIRIIDNEVCNTA
jgi:hypothetical protein